MEQMPDLLSAHIVATIPWSEGFIYRIIHYMLIVFPHLPVYGTTLRTRYEDNSQDGGLIKALSSQIMPGPAMPASYPRWSWMYLTTVNFGAVVLIPFSV